MELQVHRGDIARTEADCLMTAVNSGRMWFGGIDGVLQRLSNRWHTQLHHELSRKEESGEPIDGTAFLARSQEPRPPFGDVIFIFDNLQLDLKAIVRSGLDKAEEDGKRVVAVPTIRMGVMLGVVEKTKEEAVDKLILAIREFGETAACVQVVKLVVYDDEEICRLVMERHESVEGSYQRPLRVIDIN